MPVALMGAVLRISVSILDRLIPYCALSGQKVIAHLCGRERDLLLFSGEIDSDNAIWKTMASPRCCGRLRDGVRNTFRVPHASLFAFGA